MARVRVFGNMQNYDENHPIFDGVREAAATVLLQQVYEETRTEVPNETTKNSTLAAATA